MTLWELLVVGVLLTNAAAVLHEERFLARCTLAGARALAQLPCERDRQPAPGSSTHRTAHGLRDTWDADLVCGDGGPSRRA